MLGLNLRILRFYIGGVFAIAFLICVFMAFWIIQRTFRFQTEYAFPHPRVFLIDAIFPAMAVIYALAFWTIWKEMPSARRWGIAASILQILTPLWHIIRFPQSVHSYTFLMLTIGIAGLVVFSMRDKAPTEADDPLPEDTHLRGI
ncbi:MAG: hypothetical protein ACLPY1_07795 [Terracidiphilus sp.]